MRRIAIAGLLTVGVAALVVMSFVLWVRSQPVPARTVYSRTSTIDRLMALAQPGLCPADPVCGQQCVPQGQASDADDYYAQIAADNQLGISVLKSSDGRPDISDARRLLTYLGSSSLDLSYLETDGPDNIETAVPGTIVTTFFAPKTSDVRMTLPALTYNWRRVVRIKAGPGSPASQHHIASAYILFNVGNSDPRVPPTGKLSTVVQVMLTADESKPAEMNSAFWLLYSGDAGDYSLARGFSASFDGGDFSTDPKKDYFVPKGCGQCHGGSGILGEEEHTAALNFLDTDHWADRVKDTDFIDLAKYFPVLFDSEKNDPKSHKSERAFNRIRTLNGEIAAQNKLAGSAPFRMKAVERWNTLHQSDSEPKDPWMRGFATSGSAQWTSNDDPLLRSLEQYCYRCHSTIGFSVFDRSEVGDRAQHMAAMVTSGCMPRDRRLDANTVKELSEALKKLQTSQQ